MTTVTIFTAIYCLVVGVAVLWANPRRFAHQAFLAISAVLALWLFAVSRVMILGELHWRGESVHLEFWLRGNAAIISFLPCATFLLKCAISFGDQNRSKAIGASMPYLIAGIAVAALCYSNSFLFINEGALQFMRGWNYYISNIFILFIYVFIGIASIRDIRKHTGVRRIELQFVTAAFFSLGFLLSIVNPIGNWLQIRALNRSSIFIVFFGYTFLAWAITHRKIFDARHVFLTIAQRFVLITALCFGIVGMWLLTEHLIPSPFDLLVTVLACASCAWWLDRKMREWLKLDGTQELRVWRTEVLACARSEATHDNLVHAFQSMLQRLCDTESAQITLNQPKSAPDDSIESIGDRIGFGVLCDEGWITPENLQRRRPSAAVDDLRAFMAQYALGALIAAPHGSPKPSLLLSLGVKTSSRPFTYPEIERLQNIAELMDNILTHSRLNSQAALQAKIEHLAMMSRGLAHDLKNLITPVSSFLIHTDGRYPADSPEAEVHAAARRSVRVMTEYVRESMFFSERLQPKFELVDLGAIFRTVREITSPRAQLRGVAVSTRAHNIHSFAADAVLLQRLFANLVTNAIDASAAGQTVTIVAVADREGWLQVQVTDKGQGISPEDLRRIFDPYFTTKDLGSETRGFGLGLTICQKIVNLHGGIITVKSQLREGTCVTVNLLTTDPSQRLLPTQPCLALP